MSSAQVAEIAGIAAAPEIGIPVALFNETADSTAKLITAADNQTTRTAITTTGSVVMNAQNVAGTVTTAAIDQTPTILSFPARMMGMSAGIALIVIGVILVLISIAVISAQSSKTAGIMIFFVGFLMSGAGGFMIYKTSGAGNAVSAKPKKA